MVNESEEEHSQKGSNLNASLIYRSKTQNKKEKKVHQKSRFIKAGSHPRKRKSSFYDVSNQGLS